MSRPIEDTLISQMKRTLLKVPRSEFVEQLEKILMDKIPHELSYFVKERVIGMALIEVKAVSHSFSTGQEKIEVLKAKH